MEKQRFGDVVQRAIDSDENEIASKVAARWGTNEQNLRRWRYNQQSPKFDDLIPLVRRMTARERLDVARVLFGEKFMDDLCDEAQDQVKQSIEKLDAAKTALQSLVRV